MARPAVYLIAIAVALGVGACGSDKEQTASPSKGSKPSATASPAATEDSNRSSGY